jgi:type II secretory pathway pseudopilin PulG
VAGPRSVSGVTLIELLVVITIMMTVLGLVGGATVESVDRARAQTELISLYSLFKKSSVRAFASGSSLDLRLEGAVVDILIEGRDPIQKQFEHLLFDDQVVSFNRNGLPDTLLVTVKVRGISRQLDLHSIFDNFVVSDAVRGDFYEQ